MPVKTSIPKSTGKFPIAGIGASAGGLEALEQFLSNVPKNSGMAYVVIQHLDPTQKGMLPELLQRISPMKVYQAKDRLPVKVDSVYVIPPNSSMSILNGVLHLFDPIETRGMRLPIDFFFRSLADDRKELSIGIILSGMGSDGSLGLRSIKEKNGIAMVQNPPDAKFDSMPRNAIDSVLVDIVAPASELPAKLIEFQKHIPAIRSDLELEMKDKSSLDKIIILLRNYTGNDFSSYKKTTLYRRIERRMTVHKIDKIISYVHYLQRNPKEVEILFKELLIGVTSFFRDAPVWKKLKESILPTLISKLQPGSVLRAWVPGCSTGEEAYSLAIVFKEVLEKVHPRKDISLQIFATDINADAIEVARKGLFQTNIASDISADRLDRYFLLSEDGYRIKSEIREMLVFAQHNVILHPPFTKIDILSCRNLLIYLDADLQKQLIGLFFYSINPEGIMLLGSSETLGKQSHLFTPLDIKLRVYKRPNSGHLPESFDFPYSFSRNNKTDIESPVTDKSEINIQTLAEQVLLQHYVPSGVMVNEQGDIIYIRGHTGKYLEPAVGKANLNIFAMLRDGLRSEVHAAFLSVIKKKETVVLRNIKIGTNGDSQTVNVDLRWIDKPEPLYGHIMIIFADVKDVGEKHLSPKTGKKNSPGIRQKELEDQLQQLREEMRNTVEEVQTSQEELRSTNEELQSTNEELQSTNEELTTSKEEMQSLNEELQTVNAELQAKVDDYSRVNNDMKNLLNSTEIATLFLDKELNIRRFTHQATKIFKLINSDIGRPFTDQVSDLVYPELAEDALEVLRSLVFTQKEIPSRDGRWFLVRIMPYRTLDDRIDGLVITFIDISNHKKIEENLIKSEAMRRILLSDSAEIKIILSNDGNILELNNSAELFFGYEREDCINKSFIQMFIPEKSRNNIEKQIKMQFNEGLNGKLKMKIKDAKGNTPMVECSLTLSLNKINKVEGMILSIKNNQDHE
jgi:two-component system, chemotaxis family, CheB/CheR fusion protein